MYGVMLLRILGIVNLLLNGVRGLIFLYMASLPIAVRDSCEKFIVFVLPGTFLLLLSCIGLYSIFQNKVMTRTKRKILITLNLLALTVFALVIFLIRKVSAV